MKLKEPFGPWKNLMAFINGGPAIYPASVLEGATKEPISPENYIGTGPLQVQRMGSEPLCRAGAF